MGPLIDSILEQAPDLLGVQEANEPWMEQLPSQLPGYDYVGVGRDDGDSAGEFAAVFYRRDRFELLGSGTFWLSETPEVPSLGWGANLHRICTYAHLRDRETGQELTHYNTHLDHESQLARSNGTTLILDRLEDDSTAVILTGDFNYFSTSSGYKAITEERFVDARKAADESESYGTVNYFVPERDTKLVIDYVFVDDERFDTKSYRVDHAAMFDDKPVSDHYPVIVDLEMRVQD